MFNIRDDQFTLAVTVAASISHQDHVGINRAVSKHPQTEQAIDVVRPLLLEAVAKNDQADVTKWMQALIVSGFMVGAAYEHLAHTHVDPNDPLAAALI